MPYNTTAIPPRKEITGTTQLPLTRVKKIINMDQDINTCSNNAAFVITIATEMFIQHFAQEAHNQAKIERKPRRNIQYKDMANAVLSRDNLEFLEDVIPKVVSYGKIKDQAAATRAKLKGEKKTGIAGAAEDSAAPSGGLPNGKKHKTNGHAATNGAVLGGAHDDDPSAQLEMEMRQAQRSNDGDVDMTG
ncbi:histone-fold-containing protein [Coniochaeta sp. 2T2.1]|nr:histone-fold-containing protein [Coniochaeta sp. 2T2.1]